MRPYLDLLQSCSTTGVAKDDRTGTGTLSVFGHQMRFDLAEGFPLVTTKKVHTRSIFHELLWFLRGDTNVTWLQDRGVTIWDEWADADGDLGPVYGHQWRSWPTPDGRHVDQIAQVVEQIRTRTRTRAGTSSAPGTSRTCPTWRCRRATRCSSSTCADGRLSCQLYQRSADVFLGVPFNIASYALLTHMVAQVTGLEVGEFVHTLGDAHLYLNHLEQARLQLTREPRPLPRMRLDPSVTDLDAFDLEHITLEGYDPHPASRRPWPSEPAAGPTALARRSVPGRQWASCSSPGVCHGHMQPACGRTPRAGPAARPPRGGAGRPGAGGFPHRPGRDGRHVGRRGGQQPAPPRAARADRRHRADDVPPHGAPRRGPDPVRGTRPGRSAVHAVDRVLDEDRQETTVGVRATRRDRDGHTILMDDHGRDIACDVRHRVRYDRDVVRVVVPRSCLGDPGRLRFSTLSEQWGRRLFLANLYDGLTAREPRVHWTAPVRHG